MANPGEPMSQPSNDAEVEHVLSAIRRLVEEGPPKASAPLVLGSALRVARDEPAHLPDTPVLRGAVEPPSPAAPDPLVLRNALPAAPAPPDPEMADLESDPGTLEAAREEAAAPAPAAPWPDEAALRALVAEVLREELRGEFGERLTRNLRKLVRREVMQALSTRDA